jgi:hypothetical protein
MSDNHHEGFAIELMFKRVICHFKWKVCSLPSKEDLLLTMQSINPKRLVSALDGAFKGQRLKVEKMSNQDIMDRVYGVDFLLEMDTIEGWRRIAVDVTCDITKVDEKVDKLNRLKSPIRVGLKADHCLVICWVEEQPFGKMTEDEKRIKVWEKVSDTLDWMVQEEKWVSSVVI